jgi:NADH-quinone oxidoreductase subunit H
MVAWWNSLSEITKIWILAFGKGTLLLVWGLLNFAVAMMLERKVSAWFQNRVGPWRSGLHGWIQAIPDLIKLWLKEYIQPRNVDKPLYIIAPFIGFTMSILVWLIIPIGPNATATNLDIGIIFIAAITGYDVIMIFMAGWGSNNKYSLLGAMRGAAQMISYEVTLVMSIIGVVMMAGSLRLSDIVDAQAARGALGWYLFPQLIGFIVFLIASLAELNRAPFDLSEAESELVSGYHTEYTGMRWAAFMLNEYIHLCAWSALAATLFLGGWVGPTHVDIAGMLGNLLNLFGFVSWSGGDALLNWSANAQPHWFWLWLWGFFWFSFKTYLFVFLAMWIRWTLPRVRIDQLMDLGWKFLLPVALGNIFLTGVLKYVASVTDGGLLFGFRFLGWWN